MKVIFAEIDCCFCYSRNSSNCRPGKQHNIRMCPTENGIAALSSAPQETRDCTAASLKRNLTLQYCTGADAYISLTPHLTQTSKHFSSDHP